MKRTAEAKPHNEIVLATHQSHLSHRLSSRTHTHPLSLSEQLNLHNNNTMTSSSSTSSPDPKNVRQWLSDNHPKHLAILDKFAVELKLGRLNNTSNTSGDNRLAITTRTLDIVRVLIGSTRWKNAAQLLFLLRGIGHELHLCSGGRHEPAIGNVVRRIMAAVREEVLNADNKEATAGTAEATTRPSMQSMLWANPQQHTPITRHDSGVAHEQLMAALPDKLPAAYYVERPEFKQTIMEAIQEIMLDLEDTHKNIVDQALDYIHAEEIVMTYGKSNTILKFLLAAHAKKRTFQVVVCEGAPQGGGVEMAKELADAGIDVIVVNDSAAFAIMARVNKVLLPAHAVLANGGLITSSGCNMVALAACKMAVPVVIVTGIFKLCPMFPHEGQDTLQDVVNPCSLLSSSKYQRSDPLMKDVEFVNPVHDYIAPELVNLYVTNVGAFQTSYMYRLLAENYHSDDWESFE